MKEVSLIGVVQDPYTNLKWSLALQQNVLLTDRVMVFLGLFMFRLDKFDEVWWRATENKDLTRLVMFLWCSVPCRLTQGATSFGRITPQYTKRPKCNSCIL